MEASSISGRVDVPMTAGTLTIAALVLLFALNKLTVSLG
ncbi:hypothetical protein Toil_gp15 [Rhodococcus phage Toil]|jgi:hypothetical protein|uniref:Uncharacterized protein n=1 Tax=Rhodococcus phage Toil TaxID=1975614 RepID=A0A1W6DXR0_9VIRU|nr:hypothetical protein KMD62_gp15 [Rhodococcus phage Toil]ARK07698.1 hypothetical protein Toil_gp15 [Rhodococcus phage Toil]